MEYQGALPQRSCAQAQPEHRPNRRLQLTAFGAQDRLLFDTFCGARLGGS
jgi:hypothetical protein